jgi:hypothetical protein
LEQTVEDLHRQMQVEKKDWQSRHADELEKLRANWDTEKETMVLVLQKECNGVFDNRKRNWTRNTSSTPRSMAGTPHYYHQAPSSGQHQPPRPSPLSINSPVFFPDKTPVDVLPSTTSAGRATYIAPSPSRNSSPSETGGGGPPSMISQTYSDIDSVLRETEELVQSVL